MDHNYKQSGKYIIFETCPDCDDMSKSDGCHCMTCEGKEYVAVDPAAILLVLRLDEDPHARVAATAYAQSVQRENPQFAIDIRAKLAATHKPEFEA